jgi:hypothetical protein
MAKKQRARPTPAAATQPKIYLATIRSTDGAVVKGEEITRAEAEKLRRTGKNVVVCGPDHGANLDLAEQIEESANGRWKRCPFHRNAGAKSLPHYQPDPRPPEGHTFYETANRKAV